LKKLPHCAKIFSTEIPNNRKTKIPKNKVKFLHIFLTFEFKIFEILLAFEQKNQFFSNSVGQTLYEAAGIRMRLTKKAAIPIGIAAFSIIFLCFL
jgi:hypothetical protein